MIEWLEGEEGYIFLWKIKSSVVLGSITELNLIHSGNGLIICTTSVKASNGSSKNISHTKQCGKGKACY